MHSLEIAQLPLREFTITNVDCYEQRESKSSHSHAKRYRLSCYGSALARSEDLDIFFFWYASSHRRFYQEACKFKLAMDEAGIITADINTILLDAEGRSLDQVDANAVLIEFIKQNIEWKSVVLKHMPQPRLSVVNRRA